MRIFSRGEPKASCSFCGKPHDQVNKLVAGPDVLICDSCVAVCADITARGDEDSKFIKSRDGIYNLDHVVAVTEVDATQKDTGWDTPPPMKELLLQFPGGIFTRLPLTERERIEKFLLRGKRTT